MYNSISLLTLGSYFNSKNGAKKKIQNSTVFQSYFNCPNFNSRDGIKITPIFGLILTPNMEL